LPHALLVDDDVNFVLGLAEVVGREGFTTKAAHTLKEARAEIGRAVPDVVLVDLHLPDGTGIDLFRDLEASPATEIVLITGQASVDTAVARAPPTISSSPWTWRACVPCSRTWRVRAS